MSSSEPPRARPRLVLLLLLALLLLFWLSVRACVVWAPRAGTEDAPWGGLTVRTLGDLDASGDPVVVLLHGYGADEDDLLPLARGLNLEGEARLILPGAPLSRGAGGKAWWPLELSALRQARRARDSGWMQEVPEGLPAARQRVLGLLRDVQTRLDTPMERIALVGFSQGAMLAVDAALHAESAPGAVASLSGGLTAAPVWRERVAGAQGMPVLLSHGKEDELIPIEASIRLRALLEEGGAQVSWAPFDGGHHIPTHLHTRLSDFLREALLP